MSPLQRDNFYLPAWTTCSRANNWHNLKALRLPPREPQSPLDAELLGAVRGAADQLARAEHRGLRTNDFRYACHIVALKINCSSSILLNDQVQRVVELFRVLAEPLNVEAVLDWENPGRGKKRNLIKAAKAKAPEAYTRVILRDRFGGRGMDDLSIRELQQLCMTLNNRKEAWRRPAANAEREPAGIECPF